MDNKLHLILACSITWLELAIVDLRLRLFPHAANKSLFVPQHSHRSFPPKDAQKLLAIIEHYQHYVRCAAARSGCFNMSCLRQSIVLKQKLGRRNIATEIVYGSVRTSQQAPFSAHAWLRVIAPEQIAGMRIDMGPETVEVIELHDHHASQRNADEI